MKFSLVLATVERVQELERFLAALAQQDYPQLKLIVVDQNPDDRLAPTLASYEGRLPILHTRSARGQNRGRNEGLRYIDGDIVAFPDDDCWYPPHLLSELGRWFQAQPYDGLCLISRDAGGKPSNKHWARRGGEINLSNVWRRAISYTIFLRRKVIEEVGNFDESIGPGAGTPWGSADETDYLIRALRAGFRLYYEPTLSVFHPQAANDGRAVAKAYAYGLGFGHVLRRYHYPLHFAIYWWFRSFGGALLSLLQFDTLQAQRYWAMLRGRIKGWSS